MRVRSPEGPEAGYSLAALLAAVTMMLFLMSAAVPTWRYVMKNDREEELLFRGFQIADAIQRYQSKNGNLLPPSLDVLMTQRFLRKRYKDPMTKEGEWRLVHQGEVIVPTAGAGASATPAGPSPTPPTTLPSLNPIGASVGAIIGVASKSTEKSLRLFNGKAHYNEWIFGVGMLRVVGRQAVNVPLPGTVAASPQVPSPLPPTPSATAPP